MDDGIWTLDASAPFTGVGRFVASLYRLPAGGPRLLHARLDRGNGAILVRPGYDEGEPLARIPTALRKMPPSLWNLRAGSNVPGGVPVHLTTQNLSRLGRPGRIVTVHDLFYRTCARNASDKALGLFLYGGIANCDLALCDSQETADTLQRLYRMPTDRIRVVPLFVDPLRFPEGTESPLADKRRPYFLHVSSEEPRKRFETVLKGFARIARSPGFRDHMLVKVGRPVSAKRRAFHMELARELGIAERLVFLDRVEDPSLGALYRGAHALLMPSSAEGFGFPLLEAMGQGCPVVAGDIGALRELGGDVAGYAHPDDFARLAEAALSIPTDGNLRDRLAESCRRQAALFSPERFSRTMLEIYSDWAG